MIQQDAHKQDILTILDLEDTPQSMLRLRD